LRYIFVTILLLFTGTHLFAQKDSVIFILVDTAGGSPDYYLAGTVNGWNPHDSNYKFKRDEDGTFFLSCTFTKGSVLEFKFTRGSWDKAECSSTGAAVSNRILKTDTAAFTVYYISGWTDRFKPVSPQHTASLNVSVLDTAFNMPQLNRKRRIWVYLPPDYHQSKKHYPVLYMHDGQNLFDNATSYAGEWGVDETLDSLIAKGKAGAIVVGIDNGAARMSEYNPYSFTWKNAANATTFLPEGNEYLAFLVTTLKPYIDKQFRTLPSKENTMIAGSSMGGLISYYAALNYSQVFGKAGVFSPAFWTAPAIKNYTDSAASKVNGKFFFYMGAQEGADYVNDMNAVMEKLGAASSAMVYAVIDTEGRHNELYWRKWFADFYVWMMADGYNSPVKIEE
jgi:predicted alpha/beta superfamily hydrolase